MEIDYDQEHCSLTISVVQWLSFIGFLMYSFYYIGVCLRCMGRGVAEEYNSRFVLDLSKPNSLPSIGQGMKERTSPVTKYTQFHSTFWE